MWGTREQRDGAAHTTSKEGGLVWDVQGRDAIKTALRGRIEELAEFFLGQPSARSKYELRFGKKGSLSIATAGAKVGQWFDHEAGIGGDVFDLIAHVHEWDRRRDFGRVLEWARNWLGWEPGQVPAGRDVSVRESQAAIAQRKFEQDRDRAWRIERATRIWSQTQDPCRTLAERYLRDRAITCKLPECVRFHPRLWSPEAGQELPAVVFAITDGAGILRAVHIVYLDKETGGKANVAPAKKTLGALSGHAIRLRRGSQTHPVIIAEGPETALSAFLVVESSTVWAAAGLSNLGKVRAPHDWKVILISDGEAEGTPAGKQFMRAIRAHQERGHDVAIARSPIGDMNDLLMERGTAAVRAALINAIPTPAIECLRGS